ncbi:MAG: nucleotidyltransferase family protein [Alphaproteobacteria bacterium]|nr:nucleotidyltransferase family protein [Alphaproteobacteria bacterium]
MVLAAGLGTRLRPLTLDRPKALVEVHGRALIDHVLDRLAEAGVRRVVVNVHAFADALETHLAARRDLAIEISDERDGPLETAGGLKRARPRLGDAPLLVANVDTLWRDAPGASAMADLIAAWDPARMDDLLLLARRETSLGFEGPGDFSRAADGVLTHRGAARDAPFVYAGVHIMNPALIDAWPEGAHGMLGHWLAMAPGGRLRGETLAGTWMHVGDPEGLAAAEAFLATAAT